MAITEEEVKQARQDAKNEKNQRRMEKEIYGSALPNPNDLPEVAPPPTPLPSKSKKKKGMGEGMSNYRKGGKVKKYADGGMTQQPTYPFYGNQPSPTTTSPGVNQTFNVDASQPQQPNPFQPTQAQPAPQAMKKGGSVKSSASSRGDGIAMRGKTKGRMI